MSGEKVKNEDYMRGFKDGLTAPRTGSEIMRPNGDRGVITHVDYETGSAYVVWFDGRTSCIGVDTYPITFRFHDIPKILRELRRNERHVRDNLPSWRP